MSRHALLINNGRLSYAVLSRIERLLLQVGK
jgi:hypothetical protein